MRRDFHRVAIVNSGEPAMRLIQAVRELNLERGLHLETIALYTEPDRGAAFVREAHAAASIGPATYVDVRDGPSRSSYLNHERLAQAIADVQADAVWAGFGAGHAALADLCERLGVVFIGPPTAALRALGNKISAKRLAEKTGVPVASWSGGPVETVDDALACAERIEYPVVIKAAAGSGALRSVDDRAALASAFEGARAEALATFGDATVFLEKRLSGARHVAVIVVGDQHGNVWACGTCDGTLQRRHRKVVVEARAPLLAPAEEAAIRDAATRIAARAGYTSVGAVEFLFDAGSRRIWFVEVDACLPAEHAVIEATTALDLAKLQIHVARGGVLDGSPPAARGHAIEVRLRAEDPERDFAPAPGLIEVLRTPSGPGLRIDTGVAEGDAFRADPDAALANLVAWGQTRDEARARLTSALARMTLVIRGGTSDRGFLLDLLQRPELARGDVDVTWIDALTARGDHVSGAHADVALLAVAIDAYAEESVLEQSRFFASAVRGRPKVGDATGHAIELHYRGGTYAFTVLAVGPDRFRVDLGASCVYELREERVSRWERRLTVFDRTYRVLSIAKDLEHLVEVEGVPHRISRDADGAVRAPTPAVVLRVPVKVGDVVSAGDRVAVLETMKMELSIDAPAAGRVRDVLVTPNVQVDAGVPLVVLEPISAALGDERERVRFSVVPPAPRDSVGARERWRRGYETLRRFLLGYDVDEATARRIPALWQEACSELSPADPEVLLAEEDVLGTFADVQALFRRLPAPDDEHEPATSVEEHLFVYLRAVETRDAGLPAAFLDNLLRALARYGVTSLDPTPELRSALVLLFKSRARSAEQAAAITGMLDRRRLAAGAPAASSGDSFHSLIDRVAAVARRRFASVHEAALEVRHAFFDEPLFQRARAAIDATAAASLAALDTEDAGWSSAPDRHIDALVECSEPLIGLFAPRYEAATPRLRAAMLEVLLRRYYRIRALARVEVKDVRGSPQVAAEYPHEGRTIRAIATTVRLERLELAAASLTAEIERAGDRADIVVDVYAFSGEALGPVDEVETRVRQALHRELPRGLRRVVVVVQGPHRSHAMCFTYRSGPEGLAEERVVRGLHPMLAKRMQLWRLANFELTRMPSTDDVYLFRAVARANRKDERLVCLAEVRDLTPVRDASGAIVQLPYLERILAEALAAIRRAQSARPARERYQDCRVLLYLWPPLVLSHAELGQMVKRLAPGTDGLGIEQVLVYARIPSAAGGLVDRVLCISNPMDVGLHVRFLDPDEGALETLSEYERKVLALKRRGLLHPHEIIRLLTPSRDGGSSEIPRGEFVEHDLDASGALVPVERSPGNNEANIVVGIARNFTAKIPEGMARVVLLGDASREMGSVSEPECRRILAALRLAEELRAPLEWFALSAGAKISMQSGTENMDWISAVLRGIVEHTQRGGEINVVVCGINVGAQPYWNAEATMLMHTRGILVMLADSAMVLTGKQALDYSGSVSAEDNLGIGGYERIMGPNGEAQYVVPDIAAACSLLLAHYEHTYVVPGERFPRRAETTDPASRDVRSSPHPYPALPTVGDVFGDRNPDRKLPFDIRAILRAVVDQDHAPLERWRDMRDAEIAVAWDAHLGGRPVCVIGIESHPLARHGFVPADGPQQWTSGTLFPRASKKVARAINAASENRPLVVLANLSGFDGSPESMRSLQLEYGAEIGRAVVNFDGPIVFAVVSRYHGGAFVVFSKKLNDCMEVVALEGARASVIGGAPAAAVVFSREVEARTGNDARVAALEAALTGASAHEKAALRARLTAVRPIVRSEKLGEVADDFDRIHSVERALRVGSLDRILPPAELRPYLIDAVERGIARTMASLAGGSHLRSPRRRRTPPSEPVPG